MAYAGTTSTSPNVPFLITQGIAYSSSNVSGSPYLRPGGGRLWMYQSTHDSTDVTLVNFFGKDVQRLGFAVGDVLWISGSSVPQFHMCINIGATTSDFGTPSTAPGSTA